MGVGEGMLLVAIGCGRLPGMLDITANHGFVVLGTMEGRALTDLANSISGHTASRLPVYFDETG